LFSLDHYLSAHDLKGGQGLARIRSVKPEFWDDRKLAKRTSRDARLLYIALWNLADEHARLNGDPQWIKGQAFSYDDDLDATAVAKLIEELAAPVVGAVVPYEVDGDPYLFLPKLGKHQRLEPEKVRSRLPDPPGPGAPDPPPDMPSPESGTDQSERRADESARDPDESARGADQSAAHADKPALLYVAGSMEHGAGGRGSREAHAVPNAPAPGFSEIPDGFQPSDAMRRWAHSTYPGLDLDFETAQFIRHFRAEGKRKKSWVDAWQKWIADSHARRNSRASPPAGDRRQQATDEKFARAMERARAKEGTT